MFLILEKSLISQKCIVVSEKGIYVQPFHFLLAHTSKRWQCAHQIESSTWHPPGQTSGIWLLSVPEEWGVWRVRPSVGCAIWILSGWGGENRTGSVKFQMVFFVRAPKSLTTINTCLDEMEEFKGRDIAISWVTVFFLLATEVSKKFCLRNSSLSYYWVETVFTRHIAYGTFSHPISMSKLYVSVKGNQPTLKYSKRHEVVNTCYVFSTLLNNLRRVSQSEELTLAYWHCPTW